MKSPDFAAVGAFIRKNNQAAKMAAVTALVVAMSAWTSCSALATSRKANAAIQEAVTIRETAVRLARDFVPATSGESDEWARTTMEAAAFGSPEASRLSLAQNVSRIAEVAGMSRVKASLISSDSVASAGPRTMGELVFEPATYGLILSGTGGVPAVSRTVLRLPPSVEIVSLSISGTGDQLTATFQLAVYQPAGGPQN